MNPALGRAARLAAILAVAALCAAAWLRPLDASAETHVDAGMKGAFAAFATARVLNGLISLAQSAQVGVQVGVGGSVQPAELLDPVNDLVERFSDYMLAATVAFGVQKVLLAIGIHWAVSAVLSALALAWVVALASGRGVPRWLVRALVLALLVRFAVPVAAVGTDLLSRAFLAPTQEAAQRSLDQLRGAAASVAPAAPAGADAGLLARLREWYARSGELGEQIARFASAAERIPSDVTDLIVVFLFRTLVFPLAFLWLALQAVRALLRPGAQPLAAPR